MENSDERPKSLPEAGRNLCICPDCNDRFVQLIDWGNELGDDHMVLTIGCSTCGWTELGVYHQNDIANFEIELDDGLTKLTRDHRKLRASNRFVEAEFMMKGLSLDTVHPKVR